MRVKLLLLLAFLLGYLIGLRTPVPLHIEPYAVVLEAEAPTPEPEPFMTLRVNRVSFYNAVPRQTDASPEWSSCGLTQPNQLAISREVFFNAAGQKHLCGRRATLVTDRGEVFEDYVINDTLSERFISTVDVLWHNDNEDEALASGITTGTLFIWDN